MLLGKQNNKLKKHRLTLACRGLPSTLAACGCRAAAVTEPNGFSSCPRWFWGAEWSPSALIPHTCGVQEHLPAPHRCGKVPGVSTQQQTWAQGTTREGQTPICRAGGCSRHVSPQAEGKLGSQCQPSHGRSPAAGGPGVPHNSS